MTISNKKKSKDNLIFYRLLKSGIREHVASDAAANRLMSVMFHAFRAKLVKDSVIQVTDPEGNTFAFVKKASCTDKHIRLGMCFVEGFDAKEIELPVPFGDNLTVTIKPEI